MLGWMGERGMMTAMPWAWAVCGCVVLRIGVTAVGESVIFYVSLPFGPWPGAPRGNAERCQNRNLSGQEPSASCQLKKLGVLGSRRRALGVAPGGCQALEGCWRQREVGAPLQLPPCTVPGGLQMPGGGVGGSVAPRYLFTGDECAEVPRSVPVMTGSPPLSHCGLH